MTIVGAMILLPFVLIIGVLIAALISKKVRREEFWVPCLTLFVGLIVIHVATLYYLNWKNSWALGAPGMGIIASYVFYLLSLIPPAIWWAVRRFQFEKSRGPFILWIVMYVTLVGSDFLTGALTGTDGEILEYSRRCTEVAIRGKTPIPQEERIAHCTRTIEMYDSLAQGNLRAVFLARASAYDALGDKDNAEKDRSCALIVDAYWEARRTARKRFRRFDPVAVCESIRKCSDVMIHGEAATPAQDRIVHCTKAIEMYHNPQQGDPRTLFMARALAYDALGDKEKAEKDRKCATIVGAYWDALYQLALIRTHWPNLEDRWT